MKSFIHAGLVASLLFSMTPNELLAQSRVETPTIAQEFERDPNEDQIIRRMQEQLNRLMQMNLEDIEPAELSIPDYDVVKKLLKRKMSDSILQYFENLELINKEITKTFSELIALKKFADQNEMDPDGPLHGEYIRDLKLKIPALNTKINGIYSKAIKDLSTMSGTQEIAVTKKNNQFKQRLDSRSGLMGLCSTRLCVNAIAAEVSNWHLFTSNFNRKVDFVNFNGGMITTRDNVRTSAFVTHSILDASRRMLDLRLKTNKEYTVPGIVAHHMSSAVKVPAAIATAIIAAPVYLIEKPAQLLKGMTSTKLKLELALKDIETYKDSQIRNSLKAMVAEIAKGKDSAIYYAEDKKAETIRQVVLNLQETILRTYKVNALDEFTNEELLSMVEKKILTFDILLQKLSSERLVKLTTELSPEQTEQILIQRAVENPEKIKELSLDQMITLLERSDIQLSRYVLHIEKEISTLVKRSDIIAKKFNTYRLDLPIQNPQAIQELSLDEMIAFLERNDVQIGPYLSFIEKELTTLIKRSSVIAKKYKDHQTRPTPNPTSEFYDGIAEGDGGNIVILNPKMYGSSGLVPLSSQSYAGGVCALFGYHHGGGIIETSGDHRQTAKVGVNGLEQYMNYGSSYVNAGIVQISCFRDDVVKVSTNYERIVKNLDGTSIIYKPVYKVVNRNLDFSQLSDSKEVCRLYGFREAVGTPASSGDLRTTLIYKNAKNISPRVYGSSYMNAKIDTISCR